MEIILNLENMTNDERPELESCVLTAERYGKPVRSQRYRLLQLSFTFTKGSTTNGHNFRLALIMLITKSLLYILHHRIQFFTS